MKHIQLSLTMRAISWTLGGVTAFLLIVEFLAQVDVPTFAWWFLPIAFAICIVADLIWSRAVYLDSELEGLDERLLVIEEGGQEGQSEIDRRQPEVQENVDALDGRPRDMLIFILATGMRSARIEITQEEVRSAVVLEDRGFVVRRSYDAEEGFELLEITDWYWYVLKTRWRQIFGE